MCVCVCVYASQLSSCFNYSAVPVPILNHSITIIFSVRERARVCDIISKMFKSIEYKG